MENFKHYEDIIDENLYGDEEYIEEDELLDDIDDKSDNSFDEEVDEDSEELDDYEITDEDNEEAEDFSEQFNKVKVDKNSKNEYSFLTDEEYKFFIKNNENSLTLIKKHPNLEDWQREALMDDFVKRNLQLIYFIANKKTQIKFMIGIQDLISAGELGFVKALKVFDIDKGIKFSTFAYKCINNEIKFAIRKESKHYENTTSADTPKFVSKDGKETNLIETFKDPNQTPDEKIRTEARNLEIRERLKALTPLDKYVIYTRFGFGLEEPMTQKQVAAAVQMSQANISKIEKTCLEKLKEIMTDL